MAGIVRATWLTAPMTTLIEPWLSVPDGARALEFYASAFGAEVLEQLDGDGTVEVARLSVGGAAFWIQQEAVAPAGVRFLLLVADPDAAFGRAVAAGATEVAAVHEEHGWRSGRVTDPYGHDWELSRRLG
jgi:PhnB protein